jgi:hypothetical protein
VSQLMALEDVNRGILSTAGPGNVAASNKRPGRAAAADSSPQKSSSALGKRRARDLNEKEEESSEEREDKPRRYPRNEPESDGHDVSWDRLWACPFNKRDPVRFSEQNQNPSEKRYRHCGVAILRDINRVKWVTPLFQWRVHLAVRLIHLQTTPSSTSLYACSLVQALLDRVQEPRAAAGPSTTRSLLPKTPASILGVHIARKGRNNFQEELSWHFWTKMV